MPPIQETHSLRMELTTARVKGEQVEVPEAMDEKQRNVV